MPLEFRVWLWSFVVFLIVSTVLSNSYAIAQTAAKLPLAKDVSPFDSDKPDAITGFKTSSSPLATNVKPL